MKIMEYILCVYECVMISAFIYRWHKKHTISLSVISVLFSCALFVFIMLYKISPQIYLSIIIMLLCFTYVLIISNERWDRCILIMAFPNLIVHSANTILLVITLLLFPNYYSSVSNTYSFIVMSLTIIMEFILFYEVKKITENFRNLLIETADCLSLGFILVACTLICSGVTIYYLNYQYSFTRFALIGMFFFFTLVVILLLKINELTKDALEKTSEEKIISHDRNAGEQILDAEEKLYQLTHDIKHFISLIQYDNDLQTEKVKKETEIIKKKLNETSRTLHTASAPLTFVLNIKRDEAVKHNIDFKCIVNLTHPIDMDDSDLYLVLSNVLDNAIKHIGNNKRIEVNVKEYQEMIMIEVINSIDHEVNLKNRSPMHGYGIPTIQRIMKRHNNAVIFKASDSEFLVRLLFQSKKEKIS